MKKKYTPEQLYDTIIPWCEKMLLYKSTKLIMEKYFANINYKFLTRELIATESFITDHHRKNCSIATIDYNNGIPRVAINTLPYYTNDTDLTTIKNRYYFSLSVKKLNESDEEFELRFLQALLEKCEKAFEAYIPYQMSLDYQAQNQPELL